ncbi:chromosomal replication initiation protein [Sphaerotilus natans subsp. natans DSM 6575]|uniref:Chromosomal replication initiator protein DnaA n=1 Tax=Sphaerotilus natans subsp. natans DSM 6575 TaxID=1286631 RepID=A0A059KKZ1_9BURK|nr:chromosomal replication initiation protein [Sphaerotilus natans subsp. natans DSM 6575]SIQ19235.1 chromosomal replication initiator protein DnaA [Sphaerotilus natans]
MQTDLWDRGLERLAAELPQQQFNTWIRPLPPADVTVDGAAVRVDLCAPNRFKRDWLRSQFGERIERTLSEIAGMPVRLELHIAGAREAAPASATVPAPASPPLPAGPPERADPAPAETPGHDPVQMSMLDLPPAGGARGAATPAASGARARTRAGARKVAEPATPLVLAADLSPLAESPALARLAADAAAAASFISGRLDATPPAPRPDRASEPAVEPTRPIEVTAKPVAAPAVVASPAAGAATASAAPVNASARPTDVLGAISASAALAKASAAVASRRRRAGAEDSPSPAPVPAPTGSSSASPARAAAPAPIVARQVPPAPAPGASGLAAPALVIPTVPPPSAPTSTRGRINPLLTFDTLVPGRANQMARTAALHVVGSPGGMYNPLFLYGGVGLGKTHLIHAVGNAMLKEKQDARVLYLHAEQFISDVVRNYQRKTFDELKAKYHSLDLLLIDDVQFFAGKDRTQEEFFNAFEALVSKRAHIVMTSDTYPKGLVDIDERLTSRFDSGLTVAIEPPELEMRVAILMKKAEAEGCAMPEEVAFFIAKNVRANVRELEGALRKVVAYSRFSHKVINIALTREALKDLLSIQNRQISVENIQKTVGDFYKVKIADMYSKKRPASIARPRQIAMYLAKEMTQKSLPEIGELFGGRDHTTVLYAVRKIAEERHKNTELNQQLHVLEQTLKG